MDEPVEAVRARPGEFFLATDDVTPGLRFQVDGTTYEVIGEVVSIGTLVFMATIRGGAGEGAGGEYQAMLHAGWKV